MNSFTPLCVVCAQPLLSTEDVLILNDAWDKDRPANQWKDAAAFWFAHVECGGESKYDGRYWFQLSRIRAAGGDGSYECDSLTGWQEHLQQKRWWRPSMRVGLKIAHEFARAWRTPGAV